MRKTLLTTIISCLALPVFAQDTALLLGVSRYEELSRVAGGRDVTRTADAFRDAGYEVLSQPNGTAQEMTQSLQRFAANAQNADRLVAAMAGRFVTDGARNWLLPADAKRPTLSNIGAAISVEHVLRVLAEAPGQSVLVIGAFEDQTADIGPYLRQGISDLEIPQGVLVVYGQPGDVDAIMTGPMVEPGGNISAAAKLNRRLDAYGYLPDKLVLQPEQDGPPVRIPQIDPTTAVWNAAKEADTADAYRDFLFAYPNSTYAAEARRRLDTIENDPVRLARLEEDGLNLSRNERRRIQQNLTLLEFNTRGIDGIFGPGSRGAIRNWQQSNGFDQTSFLTTEQINRIDAQASRRRAEIEAEEDRQKEEALRLERAYWEETGARGTAAGYRAYLERYPEGVFAEEATEKLRALSGSQAQEAERALNINPVLARLIESRLEQLGFNPGRVDGRFDRDTRSAISRYQTNRGLPATGYLTEATLARLLADTFGR